MYLYSHVDDPFPAVKPKKQPIEQKDNRVINMIINQNQSRKCESIKQPSHYIRVVFQNPNNKGAYISQYVDTDFIVNKEIGPGEYDTLVERKKHVIINFKVGVRLEQIQSQ